MGVYLNLAQAIDNATQRLKYAPVIKTGFWQGVDTSNHPEMGTRELLNYSISVLSTHMSIDNLVKDVKPDLPWADDHFKERVSRIPYNPPPSEEWWPHAPQGNRKFKKDGIFSHTYPERYWPKYAGIPSDHEDVLLGIRFPYGDLDDLISMLKKDPMTRQAYLPVWFPEDLGAPIDQRKPCTLGYHFIMRDNALHIVYFIRSCDFYRHFRNDIYLTVKLQHWVLEQLQWKEVVPGSFTMHITSLHLFLNDHLKLFGAENENK